MALQNQRKKYVEKGDNLTGRFCRVYATMASDIDVCLADPSGQGRPARMIRVGTAGTLAIGAAGDRDSSGTQQYAVVTATAGSDWPVCVSNLRSSGSTAADITLFW